MEDTAQPPLTNGPLSFDGDVGFLGNHPLNLDEKLRLMVPARFKAVLHRKFGAPNTITTSVVVTISLDNPQYRNATVYPIPIWNRVVNEFLNRPTVDRNAQTLQRFLTSMASVCEIDSQGRIRLDKKLIEKIGLEKKIVLVGRVDRFEIWDEKRFDQFLDATLADADNLADTALAAMAAAASPNGGSR